MQTLIKYLHLTSLRFTPGRAMVVAMLLGPAVGALLAFGAVAAQEENVVTIDNFTFTAPELTVAVGTTVKWGQSRRHTAHRGREEQGLPVEGARY